jgi:hypothetical protein
MTLELAGADLKEHLRKIASDLELSQFSGLSDRHAHEKK